MYVLYQGPLFNLSGLFPSVSYFIFLFEDIIHDTPTLSNTEFNTNLVNISSIVLSFKFKPVFITVSNNDSYRLHNMLFLIMFMI